MRAIKSVLACCPGWSSRFLLLSAFSLAATASHLTLVYLVGRAVDAFPSSPPGAKSAIVVLFSTVVLSAATMLRDRWARWFGLRLARDIRAEVFGKICDLGPAYVERSGADALAMRLVADVQTAADAIGPRALVVAGGVVGVIGALAAMTAVYPRFAGVATVCVVAFSLPLILLVRRARALPERIQAAKESMRAFVLERLRNTWTLRGFGDRERERRDLLKRDDEIRGAEETYSKATTPLYAVQACVGVLASVAALMLARPEPNRQGITAGSSVIVVYYTVILAVSLIPLARGLALWRELEAVSERLGAILNEPLTKPGHHIPEAPDHPTLRIRDLHFGFPQRPELLCGLELSLEGPVWAGITGYNGAGKSTLARLIGGAYAPQQGSILLYDAGVGELDPSFLRHALVLVQAHESFFAASVFENMAYARQGISEAEVERLLDAVGLQGVLKAVPGAMSAGQRQRLAIARAAAAQPNVLILDDALSHLDSEGEATVLRFLQADLPQTLVLILSSRISALGPCRVAYRLENGRLTKIPEARA